MTTPEEVLDLKLDSLSLYMKELFGWEESTTKNYILKKCKS